MIGRSKRLLQALGAALANRQQAIRHACAQFAADSIEALANVARDCCGHGFPGSLGELFGQTMRLRVFDVQAHSRYPYNIYHSTKFKDQPQRRCLGAISGAFFCGLPNSDTKATAVLVDELDAGSFNEATVPCGGSQRGSLSLAPLLNSEKARSRN
jgi:hypothetical protein